MPVVKLNQSFAKSVTEPLAYWTNNHPKGLGLVVRPTGTKSWVLQKSGKKRFTLGHYPVMSFAQAHRAALSVLQNAPVAQPKVTLETALQGHLERMQRRGNTSGRLVENEVRRHFGGWLRRPLADITRGDCRAKHDRLSDEAGDQTADRVFRHFRAIHNTALKLHELPTNPTIGVEWHGNKVRDYPRIDLADFRSRVANLDNPLLRAWFMVALSTALRSTDCSSIQWSDLDLEAMTLHRPNPKGGRPFTLPISDQTASIFESMPRISRFVFPGHGRNGYISSTRAPGMENPHWLRHEYISIATDLGVPTYPKKLLINHSVPKADISDGYVTRPDVEMCRPFQEKISKLVFEG
jgi:hypothetical protein